MVRTGTRNSATTGGRGGAVIYGLAAGVIVAATGTVYIALTRQHDNQLRAVAVALTAGAALLLLALIARRDATAVRNTARIDALRDSLAHATTYAFPPRGGGEPVVSAAGRDWTAETGADLIAALERLEGSGNDANAPSHPHGASA